MNELEIILSDINPQEFFGNQNSNLELLKSYFPKLKIVARGNKIIAFGQKESLKEFKKRVEMIANKFTNDNYINVEEIDRVLTSNGDEYLKLNNNKESFILHGVNGKIIKAKTVNHLKLVNLLIKYDMVFAIGPAGTGKTYTGIAMAVKALK